ncbi:hypothetical protein QL285_035452 [Trifolium repens]|nr:hypothetical protein QL285_035452 [Trifolium repens]
MRFLCFARAHSHVAEFIFTISNMLNYDDTHCCFAQRTGDGDGSCGERFCCCAPRTGNGNTNGGDVADGPCCHWISSYFCCCAIGDSATAAVNPLTRPS